MNEDTTAPGRSERHRGGGVAVVGATGAGSPTPAPPSRRRAQQVRTRQSQPRGRQAGGGRALRADEADEADELDAGHAPGVDADVPGDGRGAWVPPRRGRRARRPGTVPTRLAVVLGAVALLATAAAAVFGLDWAGLHGRAQQSATVKHVSQTFLDDLTNFKSNTVDADFSALQSFASGDFATQADQFFGSNIRQELEQAQAQSEGQVRDLYVQSLSGASAQVYAVVDQTYLNETITKSGGQPVADVLRVVLGLTQVSGNWKISEVSVLQPPSSSSPGASTVPSGG